MPATITEIGTASTARLKRAATEPARVFARRDFQAASEPLIHYSHRGVNWYSPAFPTWMVQDGDCNVIARAIQRYGVREAPVGNCNGWIEYADTLFVHNKGVFIPLARIQDFVFKSGAIATCFKLAHGEVVPATPVAYMRRRFGDCLSFRYERDRLLVRAILGGKCVGIIRATAADAVEPVQIETPALEAGAVEVAS